MVKGGGPCVVARGAKGEFGKALERCDQAKAYTCPASVEADYGASRTEVFERTLPIKVKRLHRYIRE